MPEWTACYVLIVHCTLFVHDCARRVCLRYLKREGNLRPWLCFVATGPSIQWRGILARVYPQQVHTSLNCSTDYDQHEGTSLAVKHMTPHPLPLVATSAHTSAPATPLEVRGEPAIPPAGQAAGGLKHGLLVATEVCAAPWSRYITQWSDDYTLCCARLLCERAVQRCTSTAQEAWPGRRQRTDGTALGVCH